MDPDTLAKGDSESGHQQALFCWAAKKEVRDYIPEVKWLYHVPNGGSRGDTQKSRSIAGGLLKAEGVKKGVPDLDLPVRSPCGHIGLRIEMKKPAEFRPGNDRAGCSEEQKEWLTHLQSQGYAVAVAYSWREAANIILAYLEKPWRVS
jgi:hypothetical protein